MIPFASLCAIATVASIFSSGVFPQHGQYLLFGSQGYILAFIQYLSLEIAIWVVWVVIVYPRYISPLRHLPQPEVSVSATATLFFLFTVDSSIFGLILRCSNQLQF